MELLYTIINFLVFVALLYFLLKKPTQTAMNQRNTKVVEDIRLSTELKDFADQALKKSRERIKNIDQYKKVLKEEVEKDIEKLRLHQTHKSEEELRRIEEDAKQKAALQAINFKNRLEKEIKQKLFEETQNIFQNNLDTKAHDKLNKEYLKKLEEVQSLR
ncbi:MAG: hypothetical protein HYW47_02920 [Deltaproteobacteria bacterium]|nr:hypothetical protein [Deltaproteobacteria bacterium]